MAIRDAAVILDHLKSWSRNYGINWRLQIEGGDIGTIESGILDPEADSFIDSFREMAAPDDSDQAVIGIDRRYSARWDESVSGDLFYPSSQGQESSIPETKKWWEFWK
jgi:hypothetical protein